MVNPEVQEYTYVFGCDDLAVCFTPPSIGCNALLGMGNYRLLGGVSPGS